MSYSIVRILLTLVFAVFVIISGCGNDNPVSAFEPEIINDADAFQFQVTNASDVSTTLSYTWNNPTSQATIDHSTALTSGTATVTIFDADSNQVYSSALLSSGNEASATGTAGDWTVTVVFIDFDGTVNFRVEKI